MLVAAIAYIVALIVRGEVFKPDPPWWPFALFAVLQLAVSVLIAARPALAWNPPSRARTSSGAATPSS